jgi:ABC-type hemin transport system substrate-binding protein
MGTRRTEGDPHDRLTRICNAMTAAMDSHPEQRASDRCIIFLSDDERGGLVISGYDSDAEAMTELFGHIAAVFETHGKKLVITTISEG